MTGFVNGRLALVRGAMREEDNVGEVYGGHVDERWRRIKARILRKGPWKRVAQRMRKWVVEGSEP